MLKKIREVLFFFFSKEEKNFKQAFPYKPDSLLPFHNIRLFSPNSQKRNNSIYKDAGLLLRSSFAWLLTMFFSKNESVLRETATPSFMRTGRMGKRLPQGLSLKLLVLITLLFCCATVCKKKQSLKKNAQSLDILRAQIETYD